MPTNPQLHPAYAPPRARAPKRPRLSLQTLRLPAPSITLTPRPFTPISPICVSSSIAGYFSASAAATSRVSPLPRCLSPRRSILTNRPLPPSPCRRPAALDVPTRRTESRPPDGAPFKKRVRWREPVEEVICLNRDEVTAEKKAEEGVEGRIARVKKEVDASGLGEESDVEKRERREAPMRGKRKRGLEREWRWTLGEEATVGKHGEEDGVGGERDGPREGETCVGSEEPNGLGGKTLEVVPAQPA